MNAIESDFLKVIKSGISHCQMVDDSDPIIITGEETVATELSGKVERFIEWKERDIFKAFGGYTWRYGDLKPKWANISDLYSYWLKEIDTKK